MNCANHPDRERAAFCQNCGKPVCSECSRIVGNAVYCEPCLAARLAATEAAPETPIPPMPPVPPTGAPNPMLAGLLGFIPGVGAMYNGQYAKGIVHLIVFAVLVHLSDRISIFGLFTAGWVFYQVIEAHHTARARRDGTLLPNPFGLNDIGERMGFGNSNRGWTNPVPPPSPQPGPAAPFVSFVSDPAGNVSYTAPDGSQFQQTADGSQSYTGPQDVPFTSYDPASAQPYSYPPVRRFPVGAVVLIVLGVLFFLESSGLFHYFPIYRVLPFLMIALGIWIFIRRYHQPYDFDVDDAASHQLRVVRALRSSFWVLLTGIIFFFAAFNILSWSRSWPLFIIAAGLMPLIERAMMTTQPQPPYPYSGTPGATGTTPPASGTSSASSGEEVR